MAVPRVPLVGMVNGSNLSGTVQWYPAGLVFHLDIGVLVKQPLYDSLMPVHGGAMQRCPVSLVLCLDISMLVKQHLHDSLVPVLGG